MEGVGGGGGGSVEQQDKTGVERGGRGDGVEGGTLVGTRRAALRATSSSKWRH